MTDAKFRDHRFRFSGEKIEDGAVKTGQVVWMHEGCEIIKPGQTSGKIDAEQRTGSRLDHDRAMSALRIPGTQYAFHCIRRKSFNGNDTPYQGRRNSCLTKINSKRRERWQRDLWHRSP
jgi:hypothetical protein